MAAAVRLRLAGLRSLSLSCRSSPHLKEQTHDSLEPRKVSGRLPGLTRPHQPASSESPAPGNRSPAVTPQATSSLPPTGTCARLPPLSHSISHGELGLGRRGQAATCTPASCKRAPVPLPIQLPANAPGEAQISGSSAWAPATRKGDLGKRSGLLALTWLSWPFGEWNSQ